MHPNVAFGSEHEMRTLQLEILPNGREVTKGACGLKPNPDTMCRMWQPLVILVVTSAACKSCEIYQATNEGTHGI